MFPGEGEAGFKVETILQRCKWVEVSSSFDAVLRPTATRPIGLADVAKSQRFDRSSFQNVQVQVMRQRLYDFPHQSLAMKGSGG